jgi:hypothetical protein
LFALPAVNPNARSLAPLNVTPETDVLLERRCVSAAIAERIGMVLTILGLMPTASIRLSPYWLLLALGVAGSGAYGRFKASSAPAL